MFSPKSPAGEGASSSPLLEVIFGGVAFLTGCGISETALNSIASRQSSRPKDFPVAG